MSLIITVHTNEGIINLNNAKEEINNIEIETYYISEQEKNIVEDYIKSKHQISKITIK